LTVIQQASKHPVMMLLSKHSKWNVYDQIVWK